MNNGIIIEGTLTKVTSSRSQKAELTLGKSEVCWQVRDPEQVGLLTMLQNGVVRVTIENPQMDLYGDMMRSSRNTERAELELPLESEFVDEDVDGAFRPLSLPPKSEKRRDNGSDLGEIIAPEALDNNGEK